MTDFKIFTQVVEEWLEQYINEYSDMKKVIIYDEKEKSNIINSMAVAVSEMMCNTIGMFYINEKYGYNLYHWDLAKKNIIRAMNGEGGFVDEFIKKAGVKEGVVGKIEGSSYFCRFSKGVSEK